MSMTQCAQRTQCAKKFGKSAIFWGSEPLDG